MTPLLDMRLKCLSRELFPLTPPALRPIFRFTASSGIVAYSFGKDGVDWTDYLDPLTSIVLSMFIVYCALPVVKVT